MAYAPLKAAAKKKETNDEKLEWINTIIVKEF